MKDEQVVIEIEGEAVSESFAHSTVWNEEGGSAAIAELQSRIIALERVILARARAEGWKVSDV